MIRPKSRASRQVWTLFAGLSLVTSSLFPAQVFKYRKTEPDKGYLLKNVPFEKWLKRNYCGPACLAMVLNYWDETQSYDQAEITAAIFDTASQATYNSEMVLYPRNKGFTSYSFQGTLETLKNLVEKGIPVIVLTKTIQQLAKGHYRVVIGFDDEQKQIIFHDPFLGGGRAMKFKTFMKVWELGKGRNQSRWTMAVFPAQGPFPFPALQNDPLTAINLATAYYRRSDFANSRQQWEKARESLTRDPYPLYSLAMVCLREGNAAEAETYALQALRLDANSAYALDVLGLAYAKQERLSEALAFLDQAQRLAPNEKFIRMHYLQVRALRIERARPDQIKKKENKNEETS